MVLSLFFFFSLSLSHLFVDQTILSTSDAGFRLRNQDKIEALNTDFIRTVMGWVDGRQEGRGGRMKG